MAPLRSICVYCGSSPGARPAYLRAAETLGRQMAEHGIRLVYGGGDVGLMGSVARSVIEHGGQVTGIIPAFLRRRERMLERVEDLVVTEDMHERKRLMFERADAFVALPGGVGTLEEVVEQLTWAQLGQHKKPVVLADIEGFWRGLVSLIQHMREEAFIGHERPVSYAIVDSAEAVIPAIRHALDGREPSELDLTVPAGLL